MFANSWSTIHQKKIDFYIFEINIYSFNHSYCYEDEDGIHPEVSVLTNDEFIIILSIKKFQGEFLYDLQLPTTFKPNNTDQEMEQFYFLTIPEVNLSLKLW